MTQEAPAAIPVEQIRVSLVAALWCFGISVLDENERWRRGEYVTVRLQMDGGRVETGQQGAIIR